MSGPLTDILTSTYTCIHTTTQSKFTYTYWNSHFACLTSIVLLNLTLQHLVEHGDTEETSETAQIIIFDHKHKAQ